MQKAISSVKYVFSTLTICHETSEFIVQFDNQENNNKIVI